MRLLANVPRLVPPSSFLTGRAASPTAPAARPAQCAVGGRSYPDDDLHPDAVSSACLAPLGSRFGAHWLRTSMSSLGSDVPRLGFTHRGGGGIGYCGSAGPPARTFPEPWSSGRAAAARHPRARTTRSIPEETSPGRRGHGGRERCARGAYVADGGIGRFLSSSGRLASRDRVGDVSMARCPVG